MGKFFIPLVIIIAILFFMFVAGLELVSKLLPNLDEMHKMWVVSGSGSLIFTIVILIAMHLSFREEK